MRKVILFLVLAVFAPLQLASAEVKHSEPNGFHTESVVIIQKTPDRVFSNLVDDIGKWWNPDHSWSGSAENLSIEPTGGGCFCERLSNGGSVLHLTVTFVRPGSILRMRGALGPLASLPVEGVQTWALSEDGDGATKLSLSYHVSGSVSGGLKNWAGPVDGVLAEQLARLANFAETGSPIRSP